jgi:predicted S18 family serine protease
MRPLVLVFLLLMVLNLAQVAQNHYLFQSLASKDELVEELTVKLNEKEKELREQEERLLEAERKIIALERNKKWIYALGVSEGRGIAIKLYVERSPGEGRILVDTKNVLLETDVQSAMRNALAAAQNLTGIEVKEDIVFTVVNPLPDSIVLTGESAGAAMAIAIVALIENKDIKKNVVITGAVTRNGKIVKVSQIESKAQAALEAGAEILLVPKGQSIGISLEGLKIVEVESLAEAREYMLYQRL